LMPRKRLRRWALRSSRTGGRGEAPTPPAFDEHAFGVAHASTNARPNREAIPVDSRRGRRRDRRRSTPPAGRGVDGRQA
jgi:hypothetical protein